ncbi:hydrolase [Clostridium sp. YIM B02551]|uniref:hydrolase n=1 Tax=Clostridium sp. YIM B02551 TaxID=2910679 RepID=UPI001EE9CFA9|nr:hydrolase [Clostridium sp. YIM B02551]
MEKDNSENEIINLKSTALVVIDLQNGIANRDLKPHTGEVVVSNAVKLAKAFKEKDGFVVLVRVSTLDGKDMLKPKTDMLGSAVKHNEGWDMIVPELADINDTYLITKRQWGAFYGTDLDLQLRRRGIDTIVLCGISTGIGVDTTAREAFQRGYNQVFAEDAMTAMSKEEHDYVCKNIFPRIGKVRNTEEIIKLVK